MKHTIKKPLLLLAALIAALALTACGSKTKIDLQQYIHVDPYGADGYGKVSPRLDYADLETLIFTNAKEGESDLALLAKLDLLDEIKIQLDKTENLSNGDKITVTVTYPDTLEDVLDADISPKSGESWNVEVGNLDTPEKVDIFEGITLKYKEGNTLCAEGKYVNLQYNLSQTQDLHNGDVITITASAPEGNGDLTSYCMDVYQFLPASSTCEYTVSGIDEYPIRMEDIPEELFNELCMYAQERIDELGAQMSGNFGEYGYHMNHYSLDTVYVASPNENVADDHKNEVYLVYRINASNPDGTREYFYSARFPNVKITADGETWWDPNYVEFPAGNYAFFFGGEHFFCTGTEGEGFIGFETKEDFYDWYLAEWKDTWLINEYDIEE